MKKTLYFLLLTSLIGCQSPNTKKEVAAAKAPLKVVAVNYPLHYFAERLAGEYIQLDFPIPAKVDPAQWIPGDRALESYQNADIILDNGADYAQWMNNVSLPSSRIVNTTASMKKRLLEIESGASHSHGADGEHVHTGLASTTWLNFKMAQAQAAAIKTALLEKLPEHKESIENNFEALKADLMTLHQDMLALSGPMHDQGILAAHPVYQYMAQAYHLHIHALHHSADEMSDHELWHEIDHLKGHHRGDIMLWAQTPADGVKSKLKEMGIELIVFQTAANKPVEGDFISVMKNNIKALQSRDL